MLPSIPKPRLRVLKLYPFNNEACLSLLIVPNDLRAGDSEIAYQANSHLNDLPSSKKIENSVALAQDPPPMRWSF